MEHGLQLYQEEASLLGALAEFVAGGLRLEEGILVIGSTPRWELLLDRLQKSGVRAREHALRGQLRLFGAHVVLASCMSNGAPQRQRFYDMVGGALSLMRSRYERVRVVSELTDVLWREGDRQSAQTIERLWKALVSTHSCKLLCACRLDSLEGHVYDGTLQTLCDAHARVHPAYDEEGFEDAVSGAIAEVLDSEAVRMLQALSSSQRRPTQMPPGQAMLFWLKDHMPRTAERVLSRARARWNEH